MQPNFNRLFQPKLGKEKQRTFSSIKKVQMRILTTPILAEANFNPLPKGVSGNPSGRPKKLEQNKEYLA